jgi:hypothetical protein
MAKRPISPATPRQQASRALRLDARVGEYAKLGDDAVRCQNGHHPGSLKRQVWHPASCIETCMM